MEHYRKEISKYLQYITYDNFEYAVNISLKNKYIYIETPKAGCSTIKNTLHKIELEYPDLVRDDINDLHTRKYTPLLTPSQTYGLDRLLSNPDFFVFCFVRNPYTRLLSVYLDKIAKDNPNKKVILAAMGEDPADLSREVLFKDFVDVVCGQNIYDMNPHWRVQYYQTLQGLIGYGFIGRMENFENDCNYVFSKITPNYPDYYHVIDVHSTNAGSLLNKYYTDEIQEKVSEKYKMDFEYFDYDKNSLS